MLLLDLDELALSHVALCLPFKWLLALTVSHRRFVPALGQSLKLVRAATRLQRFWFIVCRRRWSTRRLLSDFMTKVCLSSDQQRSVASVSLHRLRDLSFDDLMEHVKNQQGVVMPFKNFTQRVFLKMKALLRPGEYKEVTRVFRPSAANVSCRMTLVGMAIMWHPDRVFADMGPREIELRSAALRYYECLEQISFHLAVFRSFQNISHADVLRFIQSFFEFTHAFERWKSVDITHLIERVQNALLELARARVHEESPEDVDVLIQRLRQRLVQYGAGDRLPEIDREMEEIARQNMDRADD